MKHTHIHLTTLMIFMDFTGICGDQSRNYIAWYIESCRKFLPEISLLPSSSSIVSLMFYFSLLLPSCSTQPLRLHSVPLSFSVWELKFHTLPLWRENSIILVICTFPQGLMCHRKTLTKHFF